MAVWEMYWQGGGRRQEAKRRQTEKCSSPSSKLIFLALALPAKGGSPVGGNHVKEFEGECGGSEGLLSGSEAGTDCNRVPWLV